MTSLASFAARVRLDLVLNFRNRMALVYGYLFPVVFLVSFAVIYRHDSVPLALHLGELLTVTALGGACFGLPTAMVSERERGVWRRYRVTPVSTPGLLASTLAARLVLLVSAACLQIALAVVIGMPLPEHPAQLLAAFLIASLAFLGLGLLIAMLANSVPAVQALGQCIFLPMLMIGGIAVRLSSLPDWALVASAFFPGRYAVEVVQACVTGAGLADAGFAVLALLVIGGACAVAAVQLFRWDARPRPLDRRRVGWLVAVSGAWAAVGLLAQTQGRVWASPPAVEDSANAQDYVKPAPRRVSSVERSAPELRTAPLPRRAKGPVPAAVSPEVAAAKSEVAVPEAAATVSEPDDAEDGWRSVTAEDIAQIAFDRLPADNGLVAPIAKPGVVPDALTAEQLEAVRAGLSTWPPARVEDVVQRTRNLLFVAAVPDVLQMDPIERHLPALVHERLREDIGAADLPKVLYWIAMHPEEGDDSAVGQLAPLGLPEVRGPTRVARTRVMLYAFKLLGRETGDIRPARQADNAP